MSSSGSNVIPIDPRQAELVECVARHAPGTGPHRTALEPLTLIRASEVVQALPSVYVPSLCIVVQGRKRAIIGEESYHYDAFNYLFVSVTLPMLGQILDASPERPYLCMRIDIDRRTVSELLVEIAVGHGERAELECPLHVGRVSAELLDVLLRIVRLLDSPTDLPVLGSLAMREMWYRLLRDDMGQKLRGLIEREGPVQRISRAIELLQHHYQEPLRIEGLADASHMSVSTFHARFKAVTSMSPLQFQKKLRLHAARRLMMSEGLEVATAAHRVGYASPSQFNREYRRLFGAPPRRDLSLLRAQGEAESALR